MMWWHIKRTVSALRHIPGKPRCQVRVEIQTEVRSCMHYAGPWYNWPVLSQGWPFLFTLGRLSPVCKKIQNKQTRHSITEVNKSVLENQKNLLFHLLPHWCIECRHFDGSSSQTQSPSWNVDWSCPTFPFSLSVSFLRSEKKPLPVIELNNNTTVTISVAYWTERLHWLQHGHITPAGNTTWHLSVGVENRLSSVALLCITHICCQAEKPHRLDVLMWNDTILLYTDFWHRIRNCILDWHYPVFLAYN